jgi:exodeoxyribonuclease-3
VQLRIATWNVNSVRLRLDGIAALAEEHAPDVICLQETKVVDALFPLEAFAALGYRHGVVTGIKGYNGVAIVSRLPLAHTETPGWCDKADARHALAVLENGIEINNFYVPAGGDVPDPAVNDKFSHKLQFLAEMTNWFAARKAPGNRLVLVGDLNIAPLETDVWSHKALLKVVSHTPVEVDRLSQVQASHNWVDAVRHFVPDSEKLYSWWSYRARDWNTTDKGRRLDHISIDKNSASSCINAEVIREVRGWERPSDHAPIIATLDL